MISPNVGDLIAPQYEVAAVVFSYLISVFGSFAALQCTKGMFRKDGSLNWPLTIGAAVALGGVGVWSMHFVGMVAYRIGMPISYELFATFGSLVAAIVISGLALILAGGRGNFRTPGWIMGSVLAGVGVGVCVMHYMGMYSMNMAAAMTLDLATVGLSFVIAVVAAAAALWLAFNLKQMKHRIAAAFVMGIAVCAMHYVGMSSATMICTSAPADVFLKLSGQTTQVMVLAISSIVLMYILLILSYNFAPAEENL